MSRSRIVAAALFLGAIAVAWPQTQTPLDVDVEPHHHLILENNQVHVFAVSIPVGQEAYVRHLHNFLTVTLQSSRLVMWTETSAPGVIFPIGAGDTRFFLGGRALGMRNYGNTNYKSITVAFLDPRVTNYGYQYNRSPGQATWDYGSSALASPVDDQSGFVHALSLKQAIARDVRLLPGEQLAPPEQPANELFIAVSGLDLTPVAGEDLKRPSGEVAWIEGRTTALANHGNAPARFVVLELPLTYSKTAAGK